MAGENVEALLAAAASPGPGVMTDDRDLPTPAVPSAAPIPDPKGDAGVKASTEVRDLSPEEKEIQALLREMAGAVSSPAAVTDPAAAAPATAPTATTPAAQAIAAVTAPPGTAPAAAPAAPGTQPPPDKGNLGPALRAERERARRAEADAAYWRGQAEARAQMATGGPSAGAGTPAPTPEEQIKAKRDEQKALATKFDDAKITAASWEENRQRIEDEIADIRARQTQPAADLTLEQESTNLVTQYPVLGLLQGDDLVPLVNLAYQQATREGRPIERGTAMGTLDLRTRVAKLATTTYADVLASAIAAGQVIGAPAAPAVPATPTGLSADAAARDAKLLLAATFPPNVSGIGSAATSVQPSEAELDARLATMNQADQEALLLSDMAMIKRLTGVDLPPQRR